jgi:hypothetical protein
MAKMSPAYKHDCAACRFIVSVSLYGETMDAYYHPPTLGPGSGTLVLRRSDDGSDYWSMPVDMLQNAGPAVYDDGRYAYSGYQIIAQWCLQLAVRRGLVAQLPRRRGATLVKDARMQLPDGRVWYVSVGAVGDIGVAGVDEWVKLRPVAAQPGDLPLAQQVAQLQGLLRLPERWCGSVLATDFSGNVVPPRSPKACRWCLTGALAVVRGIGDADNAGDVYNKVSQTELGLLLSRTLLDDMDLTGWTSVTLASEAAERIYRFNDHLKTTHADVMRLLDLALARAQREGSAA